jgi:hypothetical protein
VSLNSINILELQFLFFLEDIPLPTGVILYPDARKLRLIEKEDETKVVAITIFF